MLKLGEKMSLILKDLIKVLMLRNWLTKQFFLCELKSSFFLRKILFSTVNCSLHTSWIFLIL